MNALPKTFRHIHLVLAREPGHPEGDTRNGYDLVLPLTEDGHIDAAAWKGHAAECRVRRFLPDGEERVGHLARKPGGQWYFDYNEDDETGFRFGEERFQPGEYVSVRESDGDIHTFRVVSVGPL